MVKKPAKNIVIWTDWYSKKQQKYEDIAREKEEFKKNIDEEEMGLDGQFKKNGDALYYVDLIFVAAKSLAKKGKKLSLQQYEGFKALVQSFSKKILGIELPNHMDYLAKRYGLIRFSSTLAFVMGRRFGKTWTYTWTESTVLTTQPQWSSIIVNVGARVGSGVSLTLVKDFVNDIMEVGDIKCSVLRSNKEWLIIESHTGGKNSIFSSPGIETNGGKVRNFLKYTNKKMKLKQ
jgi:hypothetical protein